MSVENVFLSIGGKSVPASAGGTFNRCNPVSGEVVTVAAAAQPEDARAAADAAAAAFPQWSTYGPNARRELILRAAAEMASREEAFVAAGMAETGATEMFARVNLKLAISMAREAAAITTQIEGKIIPSDKPGSLSMAVRAPVGVILGIAPWNAPIALGVRAIVTALACGNCVILKGSELCPRTHELIVESFVSAGFPEGVVNLINNSPEDAAEVVGALIDHPQVRRINFTGSTHVGRLIAVRAAHQLKPVLLELGGKAPLLIRADADLDEAVNAAAFGAFMNQGQICMSTERIIVDAAVYDAFCAKFAVKVSGIGAADPKARSAPLGAMINGKAAAHVADLVADAVAKGARQIAGGSADGVIVQPTVLADVTSEMRYYQEESFGPLVAVLKAQDDDDAIRLANDTDYGLTASIFTADAAKALQMAGHIRSGMCHINGPTIHDEPQVPFGGVGASGYGRFGGEAGIDSFTELRWMTVQNGRSHYPF